MSIEFLTNENRRLNEEIAALRLELVKSRGELNSARLNTERLLKQIRSLRIDIENTVSGLQNALGHI